MAYNPFRNLGLKAVAVGIATLLWVAVGGEKIVERSLRVPLELQNRPADLEPVGEAPGLIDVRVRGTSTALGRLAPGDVMAVLDVATAKLDRNLFHLAPGNVRAPFGVEVSYVGSATVPLVFERLVIKRVPVLTPVATPVNLMVMGPGGYTFSDYVKFGLPIMIWYFLVAVFYVPLFWRF